jgi:hypothetical protein
MSDVRQAYSEAADRNVTAKERLGLWTRFSYYEVGEVGGESEAVAPRNVPTGVVRHVGIVNGRSLDVVEVGYVPESDLRRVTRRVTYSSEKEKAEMFINLGHTYIPLEDYPDLFHSFARLADRGEIEREVWLSWIHRYGVLGTLGVRTGRYQRNEVTDSFSEFAQEALLANHILRLFEAVTGPNGLDVGAVQKLLPEGYGSRVGDDPGQLERAALRAVVDTIDQKVVGNCYDVLVPRETDVWRRKGLSPFTKRWEFNSLLAAMWLEFNWLVLADGLRYCKAPGCPGIIPPSANSNKKTCGPACRKQLQRSKRKR